MTCLDYKGFSTWFTDAYLTKKGPQMKALKAILDRVVEPRGPTKWDYQAPNDNVYEPSFLEWAWWIPTLFVKDAWEFTGAVVTLTWMSIFYYAPQ